MQETTVTLLDARELAAWRGFLRVHSGLVRELNAELEATRGLPLAHYEVLFHLEGAPGAKLKMSELAQSVLLSQSGVTRLVDRLVRLGSSSARDAARTAASCTPGSPTRGAAPSARRGRR